MDHFVEIDDVSFSYSHGETEPLLAVSHVSLAVTRGSHMAILGRNGSGKSTLPRLINALEQPTGGQISVAGLSASDQERAWEIRRLCGMVFQNPDNQIIGTTVEEDVAFGPENLGVPQPGIRQAVDEALAYVGLADRAQSPPHLLSGGQKQKLAIAGILAMHPSCLILDEATSMLDPLSRQEFMALVQRLIREEGLTVINITHNMEEVLLADQAAVMAGGRLVLTGSPAEIFDRVALIKTEGLDVPVHNDIVYEVARLLGLELAPYEAASRELAGRAVRRLLEDSRSNPAAWQRLEAVALESGGRRNAERGQEEPVITVSGLSHTYSPETNIAVHALDDVSFDVRRGELLGIIGHSGSGKSTLIQHLNGLIKAQTGEINVLGLNAANRKDIRKIRQQVGLLFQYPEHQLFEETVFRDIAFGPRRMGLEPTEVERRVHQAAQVVGLAEEDLDRSPFELSGGQKRRAAIAGVLAMEPDVMILDEPAAGLDPAGRDEILGYAGRLRDMGVTVILVSHSMDDVARLADRVLVLNRGRVQAFGTPDQVFANEEGLRSAGLTVPGTMAFLQEQADWLPGIDCCRYTAESAARSLIQAYWGNCRPTGGPDSGQPDERGGDSHAG
jgi:energy-coupling factor transport system ATP-binding protein